MQFAIGAIGLLVVAGATLALILIPLARATAEAIVARAERRARARR